MFFPEGAVRVHVHGRPADMDKSFDGLYALTATPSAATHTGP
jgi:transposase